MLPVFFYTRDIVKIVPSQTHICLMRLPLLQDYRNQVNHFLLNHIPLRLIYHILYQIHLDSLVRDLYLSTRQIYHLYIVNNGFLHFFYTLFVLSLNHHSCHLQNKALGHIMTILENLKNY